MWQLLHDIPPGARRGASAGVFVKILKPRRISSDKRDVSSARSPRGFSGNSQAATIVALAAMSGPLILIREPARGSAAREHAVTDDSSMKAIANRRAGPANGSFR